MDTDICTMELNNEDEPKMGSSFYYDYRVRF